MILSTAPWRRAPGLVLRAPAVVVAVALSAAVLALAAASGPLFVSSTGSAALSRQVTEDCPERLLPARRYTKGYLGLLRDPAGLARADGRMRSAFAGAGLPAPDRVLLAPAVIDRTDPEAVEGDLGSTVTLFARAGVLDHVDVVARVPGAGLLVPDLAAERLGYRLGGTVTVSGTPVRVVGLYRDLAPPGLGGAGLPRYWCTWSEQILGTLDRSAPPLVLTDPDTLVRLAQATLPPRGPADPPQDVVQATWYAPVPVDGATLTGARDLLAAQRRLPGAVSDVDGELAFATEDAGDLPRAAALATLQRDGIGNAVRPVSLAGSLVALLLVAGAGAYWAERRRREVALLSARGVGPGALAVKAVLELAAPAAVGTVLGWLAALGLVAALGPARLLEPSARVEAAVTAGAGLVLGLVLLGAAAVARERAAQRRRQAGWLRRVPWEVALLVAALLAYRAVRDGGGIVVEGRATRVSPLLLAYPLLALAGVLVLAARLVALFAGPLRRRTAGLPVPAYLAARRLVGGGLVTLVLGALVAVPAGILTYGAVVTESAETATEGKAGIFTGAEVAVATLAPPGTTFDTGGHGALVSVLSGVADGGLEVGVLGVGPDVTRFAYAEPSTLGYPLADVVGRLGGRKAVLVGCERCTVTAVRLRGTTLPVEVVDRREVFPGMRLLKRPTLVVDRQSLAGVDRFAPRVEEVWTTGEELLAASAALRAAGVAAQRQRIPDQFLDVTDLVPITWTFGYLQALALLTGLVAVSGLLLHLGARQRKATVSYPMQRRMGLGRGRHLRSLAAELGVLLGAGTAAGALAGYAVAATVHGRLDVNPDYPPPPPLLLPLGLAGALAAAVVLLVLAAALATQRTADRISAAEALRVAG